MSGLIKQTLSICCVLCTYSYLLGYYTIEVNGKLVRLSIYFKNNNYYELSTSVRLRSYCVNM